MGTYDKLFLHLKKLMAQLAGAAEYTNCIAAEI